ncbi:hypothetical protein GCM10010094_36330 [Streptomyces flaveus]|uniref:Uncharacterized protein n=1 Tax=Streptomyces flaveus TaxID=66370 RepID=A0A917QWS1_9ACTN|nr:hypothetical protein GCM10010094_36330 [Streptomyces flaveus]
MGDGHLAAVDEQPARLGERDAERLDDMAERRRSVGDHGRTPLTAHRGNEEARLRRNAEMDLRSVHAVGMSSGGAEGIRVLGRPFGEGAGGVPGQLLDGTGEGRR